MLSWRSRYQASINASESLSGRPTPIGVKAPSPAAHSQTFSKRRFIVRLLRLQFGLLGRGIKTTPSLCCRFDGLEPGRGSKVVYPGIGPGVSIVFEILADRQLSDKSVVRSP